MKVLSVSEGTQGQCFPGGEKIRASIKDKVLLRGVRKLTWFQITLDMRQEAIH